VWRPGEGISRTVESDAPERDAAPRPAPPRPPAEPAPINPEAGKPEAGKPEGGKRRSRSDPTERGLRELVGAGSSQLGPVRAMRARDANRPSEADLAQAEEEIVLVHRHWKPPKNGA